MNPSPAALELATKIRNGVNTASADVLMALFDTGPEDKEACEKLIIKAIAKLIDQYSKPMVEAMEYALEPLKTIEHLGHVPQGGESTGNMLNIMAAVKLLSDNIDKYKVTEDQPAPKPAGPPQ